MTWITDMELNKFAQSYKANHSHLDWSSFKIDIFIYNQDTKKKIKLTSGRTEHKYNEFAVAVNRSLGGEAPFENAYYAETPAELEQILDYIINNAEIFEFNLDKNDALKKRTKRLSLEIIDEIAE